MYNLNGLIPSRFLSLVAHLIISISLLWESRQSVISCSGMEDNEEIFKSYHNQLIVGLSLTLSLIAFELIAFLAGVTMFDANSGLLSTLCHCCACIILTYFILDSWSCEWFWFIFAFCSVLPAVFDFFVVCGVCIRRKW